MSHPPTEIVPRYRHAIMATCCVPWTAEHRLDAPLLRRQVKHLVGHGVRDLYIFGTAGEGHAVTERQFDEITREFLAAAKAQGPEVQALVGIISLSLPTMIERIERAMEMGATRFQVSLPSWGALNDAELRTFFAETCGRFPGAEFMHYNLQRARRLLTPGEYAELARRHPNLVATKNSSRDVEFLRGLMTQAPELRHFITEGGFADAALHGPCGLLLSIASVKLELARAYFEAGARRDAAVLSGFQAELREMVAALIATVEGRAHMDGAFDQMFCKLHDPAFPLRLLPPYEAAPEAAYESFRQVLKERFPRWA